MTNNNNTNPFEKKDDSGFPHVFSASGIDCYTNRGDLFVREDTVDKILSAFFQIVNGENKEKAYHTIKEIVIKCYDKRWKEDKALRGNLANSELDAREQSLKHL